jgi:predicted nucleotidyltransferase
MRRTKHKHTLLTAFAEQRARTIHKLAHALRSDKRVVAAWLFGSLGRREEDALSDIDIWIVVKDAHCAEMVADRNEFVTCIGTPIHRQESPQNAPPNGGYLLTLYDSEVGLQHIDWYWEPASQAQIPKDVRLLFDRAELPSSLLYSRPSPPPTENPTEEAEKSITFFWAMVPITAKYIARRHLWSAISMIQMLRGTLVQIAEHTGADLKTALNANPQGEPIPLLNLLRELAHAVEKVHPLAREQGITVNTEVPLHIYRYLDQIETLLLETP